MKRLTKEISRCSVAGFSAVFTDFSTYFLFINFFNNDISKSFSFIVGTIVAFTLNKFWTFQKFNKSTNEILKFIILYSISLTVNVFVNKTILDFTGLLILAFIIATASSAILNFIGQKFWVFK